MEGRTLAFAVMAKAPQPGRVKTRLTPPLTPDQAVALGGAFIADTARVIRQVSAQAAIVPFIAYMPAGSEAHMRALVDFDIGLVLADGTGGIEPGVTGIGSSLLHATRSLFARGYHGVCLISADSPSLPGAILQQAAASLARPGDRLVLGPAEDGGYYLIGLKGAHGALFRDIVWSTASVAAETVTRAAAIGLECDILPPWYDVDDRASLDRLIAGLQAGGEIAAHSDAALRAFGLLPR